MDKPEETHRCCWGEGSAQGAAMRFFWPIRLTTQISSMNHPNISKTPTEASSFESFDYSRKITFNRDFDPAFERTFDRTFDRTPINASIAPSINALTDLVVAIFIGSAVLAIATVALENRGKRQDSWIFRIEIRRGVVKAMIGEFRRPTNGGA